MSYTPAPNPEHDAIDRLMDAHLATGAEEIAPSSGFVASVMGSIQAQAVEPPPIAFPWRRALPGAIAIACGLIALLVYVVQAWRESPVVLQTSGATIPMHLVLTHVFTPGEASLCWILLIACLSIAAVAASFRLTGRSD